MEMFRRKVLRSLPVVVVWALQPFAHAQFAQQGPKLVGGGAGPYSREGTSVALSADGNTAIIGGDGDNNGIGAAWVWTRSGGTWMQQGPKLVGTGAVGIGTGQGRSVSLSSDGNTAAVGFPADNGGTGAIWIWTRNNGVWKQQGPKLVGAGAIGTSIQGSSVALSADGNTVIAGGLEDNNGVGAAWVWVRVGDTWIQQSPKLVGGDATGIAQQGVSVALSADGNTALVGGSRDNETNGSVGAAWVWVRNAGVWTQQGQKLVGTGAVGNADQGASVALSADGNTALIGGPADNNQTGAAWVWTRSGGAWAQQGMKLVGGGALGKAFQGQSLTLSGDGKTAIVGGLADDYYAGAIWVWMQNNGTWTEEGNKLVGTGAIGNADQGTSVALSADGNTALVGATEDNGSVGAAWVFAWGQPSITAAPTNKTVNVGATATLMASASGIPAPAVQWQVSTDHGTSFSDIPSATSATYVFITAATENGNQYRAVFTNSVGTATSNAATLTVTWPVLTIQKTHTGSFTQGRVGTWAINVGNAGTGSTVGNTLISDTLPAGYTFASFTGTDWTCTSAGLNFVSCRSADTVAPGASFPTLNLTANIPSTSSTTVQNQATASGGGAVNSSTSNVDEVTVAQIPSKLLFTTPLPPFWNARQVLTPAVVVEVQDAAGNVVPGATAAVSITSTPPGVTGTLVLDVVYGSATFGNLSFSLPANYTLTATSPGVASGTSNTVSLNHLRDFAGTGRSSVLIYDPTVGTTYTALSNGNGTYRYTYNLITSAFDTLRTGDFNGDGKSDIVVYNSQTGLAYIGMSNGDGTFAFQSLFWSPGYDFVEAGDVNSDGKTDFALYNSSTGTMYTGVSDGDGTFTYKYTLISKGYTFVRLLDMNGDGRADIFLYNKTNGNAYVGVGDGAGKFGFHPLFVSPGYDLADIGDLNGDRWADVILYNSSNGNAATGISDGISGFAFVPMLFSPGFTSVRLADHTGGGLADVTAYNKNNGSAYFGAGTGFGTFNFQSLFWSPGYDSVVPQDVNGDGKVDIVLYNSVTGTEYTGISNGNGAFSHTYSYWGPGRVPAR